ncbi:hypothetical protein QBC37DRAFT_449066 [Rhypophila decipiens]|uniref:Zn(2)-C6 fungal-type domain-containing protein n=1 Tax=Rhypophila decipiens TaxID=261697 RepID=A0AAN6Y2J2_9PEZI|nr:hypothetical protein QBC37DRAFT_449066 [Rhypophila decipiens]
MFGSWSVRCTGELSGCERCEALDLQCTYSSEKAKRQRNPHSSDEGRVFESRRQRQSCPWLRLPEATEKPAAAAPVAANVTPLSDHANHDFFHTPTTADGDGAFAADIEPCSTTSIFPGLTPPPDGVIALDHYQPGSGSESATSTGSTYVTVSSTQPPSHSGMMTDTDVVFWGDNRLSAADHLAAVSILSTGSSETHLNTVCQGQHSSEDGSPGKFQQSQAQSAANRQVQPDQMREPGEFPTRAPDQMGCKCIKSVVYLINELETTLRNDSSHESPGMDNNSFLQLQQNSHGFDSALGLHKDAIRYGESMRQCRHCVSRTENRMLLLLLANRLIALCSHMASVYRNLVGQPAIPGSSVGVSVGIEQYFADLVIVVGEYEVDSMTEMGAVLRELLAFQLRSLYHFVTPLSNTTQLQGVEFHAVKNRAASLWRALQQQSNSGLSPI